uniref:Uncharacterized protein n=1 Tax=Trichuris muris TaxID=70415 RepID=A0A5S6Q7A1_TRIMR
MNGLPLQRRGLPPTRDPAKIMDEAVKASTVVEHGSKCSFDLQPRILFHEERFHLRRIKEAFCIRHNPCMNCEKGSVQAVQGSLVGPTAVSNGESVAHANLRGLAGISEGTARRRRSAKLKTVDSLRSLEKFKSRFASIVPVGCATFSSFANNMLPGSIKASSEVAVTGRDATSRAPCGPTSAPFGVFSLLPHGRGLLLRDGRHLDSFESNAKVARLRSVPPEWGFCRRRYNADCRKRRSALTLILVATCRSLSAHSSRLSLCEGDPRAFHSSLAPKCGAPFPLVRSKVLGTLAKWDIPPLDAVSACQRSVARHFASSRSGPPPRSPRSLSLGSPEAGPFFKAYKRVAVIGRDSLRGSTGLSIFPPCPMCAGKLELPPCTTLGQGAEVEVRPSVYQFKVNLFLSASPLLDAGLPLFCAAAVPVGSTRVTKGCRPYSGPTFGRSSGNGRYVSFAQLVDQVRPPAWWQSWATASGRLFCPRFLNTTTMASQIVPARWFSPADRDPPKVACPVVVVVNLAVAEDRLETNSRTVVYAFWPIRRFNGPPRNFAFSNLSRAVRKVNPADRSLSAALSGRANSRRRPTLKFALQKVQAPPRVLGLAAGAPCPWPVDAPGRQPGAPAAVSAGSLFAPRGETAVQLRSGARRVARKATVVGDDEFASAVRLKSIFPVEVLLLRVAKSCTAIAPGALPHPRLVRASRVRQRRLNFLLVIAGGRLKGWGRARWSARNSRPGSNLRSFIAQYPGSVRWIGRAKVPCAAGCSPMQMGPSVRQPPGSSCRSAAPILPAAFQRWEP